MIVHESRNSAFRRPFGAAETGTEVYLAAEKAGAADMTLRLHPFTGEDTLLPMASEGGGRFSVTVTLPETPCVLWYSFRTGDDETCAWQITVYKKAAVPDWWKDGVVYQIFPDRFARERDWTPREPEARRGTHRFLVRDWDTPVFYPRAENGDVSSWPFWGGTLRGIEEIRIVLDGVFNHTGADSVYFDKFGNYGTAEKYRSWFRFGDQYRHGYECWWDVPDLPNVEENDPSFREFLCGEDGVVRRWLRRGASGWRLDVADELPDSLIRDIRAAMKEEKEDSLLLGEVWEDASNKVSYGALREYFLGSELDATMHYPFRTAVLDFLLGKIHAQAACDVFWTIQEHYPKENLYAALNLIGSHDRARVLTVLGGDANALKMAMFLQFALPGVPSIYYGDEAGMTGGTDPYNRGSFPWGKGNAPLTDFVRSLTAMYQETPLLRRGECEMLFFGENVLGCRRFDESGSVLALVNRGEEAVECFGVTVPGRGYILE